MDYKRFEKMEMIETEHGFLAWRRGTAENIEIFDIYARPHRQGYGTELVRLLVEKFLKTPDKIIFGFTVETNTDAQAFYQAIGFNLIHGMGRHCLFWQRVKQLYETIKDRK